MVRRLEEHGHACAIASAVWHELVFGVTRMPPSRRRSFLEAYLDDVVKPSFPILPYDESAAAWHAGERARLEALGTPAPIVDSMIAAVAAANQLVLVTCNTRDFSRFANLEVEDWAKRRRRA